MTRPIIAGSAVTWASWRTSTTNRPIGAPQNRTAARLSGYELDSPTITIIGTTENRPTKNSRPWCPTVGREARISVVTSMPGVSALTSRLAAKAPWPSSPSATAGTSTAVAALIRPMTRLAMARLRKGWLPNT